MAELTSEGYQSLRDFAVSATTIPNEWDFIEIYDDTGSAVTRVSITGDSRCQWTDVDGDAILKVEFDVTASDSDISYPVTLSSSAIWDSSSGGRQITAKELMADATFNQGGDNVTVTHTVEIPQQA
jgi:hypothetical protein